MKRYFATTNAYNCIIIVSTDDPTVAVWFDCQTKEEAENMDISNVDGMNADQMRAEYPEHVFDFNPDAEEYESIEVIV